MRCTATNWHITQSGTHWYKTTAQTTYPRLRDRIFQGHKDVGASMPNSENVRPRGMLRIALLTGLVFFILGWACIRLSRETHDVSIIWVATTFATCVVLRLCHNWREASLLLASVLVAGIFANLAG